MGILDFFESLSPETLNTTFLLLGMLFAAIFGYLLSLRRMAQDAEDLHDHITQLTIENELLRMALDGEQTTEELMRKFKGQ